MGFNWAKRNFELKIWLIENVTQKWGTVKFVAMETRFRLQKTIVMPKHIIKLNYLLVIISVFSAVVCLKIRLL